MSSNYSSVSLKSTQPSIANRNHQVELEKYPFLPVSLPLLNKQERKGNFISSRAEIAPKYWHFINADQIIPPISTHFNLKLLVVFQKNLQRKPSISGSATKAEPYSPRVHKGLHPPPVLLRLTRRPHHSLTWELLLTCACLFLVPSFPHLCWFCFLNINRIHLFPSKPTPTCLSAAVISCP